MVSNKIQEVDIQIKMAIDNLIQTISLNPILVISIILFLPDLFSLIIASFTGTKQKKAIMSSTYWASFGFQLVIKILIILIILMFPDWFNSLIGAIK